MKFENILLIVILISLGIVFVLVSPIVVDKIIRSECLTMREYEEKYSLHPDPEEEDIRACKKVGVNLKSN